MAGRLRVAALVLGLVLLGGAVACGDDDSGDVNANGTSTTAPASGGSSDLGGGGVRPAPPAGDPSIRGSIGQVSELEPGEECEPSDPAASADDPVSSDDDPAPCANASGSLGSFVVDDGVDQEGASLAARVTVPSDVAILVEDGAGGWTLGSFADLTDGAAVQVWFDGPVAESYPVQATAGSIVVEA